MRTLVIGCGVIGLTTAYLLRLRGHEVTVLDRNSGPGQETSFANGALLTPSMSDPWNAPGSWRVLLASLLRSDAPLQLHLRTLPSLMGWGIEFLKSSRPSAYDCNTRRNLSLALYSLDVLRSMLQLTNIDYGRTARGSLRIFRDRDSFERACAAAERLRPEGLSYRGLSVIEATEFEPALGPIASELAGAVHYQTDETGDAYQFCIALAEHAQRQGVEFRFNTPVTSLQSRSAQVTAVETGRGDFIADHYVIAAGSFSTPLLKPLGIRLPVRPAKGYSITVERSNSQAPLRTPIVDDHLHAVVTPLADQLRVAGTAEFSGYDLTISKHRIANLVSLVRRILPHQKVDPTKVRSWCGLRALTTDGVPIIGHTPFSNLYVNTGHGHLGWTMATGSAQLLVDLITGEAPAINQAAFALARFS